MVAKALASCSEPQPQGPHAPLRGPKVPLCGSNRLPRRLRPHQGGQGLVPQLSSAAARASHPRQESSGLDPSSARWPPGSPLPHHGDPGPLPLSWLGGHQGCANHPGCPGGGGDPPLGATPQLRGPSPHLNDKDLAPRLDPVTAGPHPPPGGPGLAPQSGSADTGAPPLNLALRLPGTRPLLVKPRALPPARPGGRRGFASGWEGLLPWPSACPSVRLGPAPRWGSPRALLPSLAQYSPRPAPRHGSPGSSPQLVPATAWAPPTVNWAQNPDPQLGPAATGTFSPGKVKPRSSPLGSSRCLLGPHPLV